MVHNEEGEIAVVEYKSETGISINQLGTGEKPLSRNMCLCKGSTGRQTVTQSRAHARNDKAGQDALTDKSYGEHDCNEAKVAAGATP